MKEKTQLSRGGMLAAVLLMAGVALIVLATIHFVRHRMAYAVTDAAFVRTDSLVSVGFSQVSGRIETVARKEGEAVKKGEILARLDDTTYRLAVEQLEARLAATQKKQQAKDLFLQRLRKETVLNEEIAQARVEELTRQKAARLSEVEAIQVEIEQLQRDSDRYQLLLTTKAVSHSQAEDVATRLRARKLAKQALQQQVAALAASLVTARRQVELSQVEKTRVQETAKEIEGLTEQIRELAAALAVARDNLAQCSLQSPITGRVAKRFVSAGDLVSPQKVVYSLVDPGDIHVVALLEEQKLAGVVPDAPVQITIDAYPGEAYEGVVESILPTSAATFALAPRDISAGEFTKVAQRIPVRIRITAGDTARLRVGMGGEVEIRRQLNDHSARQDHS